MVNIPIDLRYSSGLWIYLCGMVDLRCVVMSEIFFPVYETGQIAWYSYRPMEKKHDSHGTFWVRGMVLWNKRFTTYSHCISLYPISRYISLYIVISCYISLYIVIYRYLSLYIVIYRYISLSIVIYHYISLYIVIFQCHEKSSTDHVHDMRIRSNIWGFLHRRAPSDQSSPYFGQNPPFWWSPADVRWDLHRETGKDWTDMNRSTEHVGDWSVIICQSWMKTPSGCLIGRLP